MNVTVINCLPKEAIVEYEDSDGFLQRRIIPQELFPLNIRGPADIPDEIVALGLEYAQVDLQSTLGEMLPPIRVCELEDALRRAGIWTQKDYQENANVISGVWQRLRGVDVTTIINAALRR